ncbi:hypothetical protein [Acinetobacter sp. A47]|uniref:hypothetical protein n=1 Tax=Acinetobacter sp. A47 TaxID=1561217 RepID=UPI001D0D6543|nr:hypothetical protein [Acinetobacter sp. A47]
MMGLILKKIIVLSCFIGLIGCTSSKSTYVAIPKVISKPPIGETAKAHIGDKLLTQAIYVDREALYVRSPFKFFNGYTLTKGYYLKTGKDRRGQYFQVENIIPNGGQVQKDEFSEPFTSVMLDKHNRLCVESGLNVKACSSEHDAIIETISMAIDNKLEQALIYSGKVGNKINISYRKTLDNMARIAFERGIEYDLSQSQRIGYGGALLEVIDATTPEITYRVIQNFNEE